MKSGATRARNLRCCLFFRFFETALLLSGCYALENEEVFTEDLFLRPLSDGKVLSHFYFKNTLPTLGSAEHHHVFPKAISQLVQKFHISEMELSFTQGRWNYERWGALDPIASANAKPSGVELWASFDVPLDQVDATWRNLTHALSGLFCASVNFLESAAMTVAPDFAFGPLSSTVGSAAEQMSSSIKTNVEGSGSLRYGALPREAVCTENLTPWLKLLPCRDKAGIATLLDRPGIYRGYYHSLRVHLLSGSSGTVLDQTLTLVLQPSQNRERTSSGGLAHWSLSLLFGRGLDGRCPLAKSSHVLLELEGSLVKEVQSLDPGNGEMTVGGHNGKDAGDGDTQEIDVVNNAVFVLSPYPDIVFRAVDDLNGRGDDSGLSSLLLDYWLQEYSPTEQLNIEFLWKEQISWTSSRGPFRVSRFLVGSGNQMGSIVLELKSNYERQKLIVNDPTKSANSGYTDNVHATIFHIVPWYVRLYLHTLTTSVDGCPMPLWQIASKMRILPAEDRLSPAVLEMELHIPANISSVSLSIEFDKGFLHIDEHPPDANRGFDLPSAFVRFPRYRTQRQYKTSKIVHDDNWSPFLLSLQDAGSFHIYSESLLLPLGTPDFSMPYNVITFTCTVLALYFGSLLNTLRRRIGEEERMLAKTTGLQQGGKLNQLISRYMEGKSATQKKLAKLFLVMIVVVVAIAANQFLEVV